MPYIKQQPHWEVVIDKLNMSMSDLHTTTERYETEEKALEEARKIKHPEKVLRIREVRDYTKAPQREVW